MNLKSRQFKATFLAAATLVGIATVGLAAPANAAPAHEIVQAAQLRNGITRGTSMHKGDYMIADYGQGIDVIFRLIMQSDGNLVEYEQRAGAPAGQNMKVCWATGTNAAPGRSSASVGSYAIYQADGNFVLYNSAGEPLWASNTKGKGGTTANLNSYGGFYVGTTRVKANCV